MTMTKEQMDNRAAKMADQRICAACGQDMGYLPPKKGQCGRCLLSRQKRTCCRCGVDLPRPTPGGDVSCPVCDKGKNDHIPNKGGL